jgi:uncharacterized membrane-anchored protein YitT (DUF2179 family)
MNPFWSQVVIRTTLRNKKQSPERSSQPSPFELAKGLKQLRGTLFRQARDMVLIVAGIFSAAFGFKGFLLTNHFIDGGATGISLLLSALTGVQLSLLILLVNIPFILLGYKIIGKRFAFKTILAISGLAICLALVRFPDVTSDNLLVAVFGGGFLGAGIGLSIRGGAVIDGTEILAIYLSRKLGTTIGDIIIIINVFIFSAAAYFLSVEIALFSMITYFAASKTLDFVVEGVEEYTGVTIISAHHDQIRHMIINNLGRGITIYNGKRGIKPDDESKNLEILYTVVTRLELNKLKSEVRKIDPNAFVVMNSVKDAIGGTLKKRPFKY